MKIQIATTPEQGKRLIACGVNIDTCDMFYKKCVLKAEHDSYDMRLFVMDRYTIGYPPTYPAWSLSVLLALLPDSIRRNEYSTYDLELSKTSIAYVYYADMDCFLNPHEKLHLYSDDLIEACVKAIEWLTANGYKLNELKL